MSLPIFNQPYAIDFHPTDFWGFKTTPLQKPLLTLSWRRPLSYRNQSIDLRSESRDWFLYDNGLGHERVNYEENESDKW